jgi:hypothetical protein
MLGDVVYARILGKEMIILNTQQAARDLMEKRSAIYSDRPRFVLLGELYVLCVPSLSPLLNSRLEWAGAILQLCLDSRVILPCATISVVFTIRQWS